MDNNIPAGYNSDGRKGLDYIDLPERSIPKKKMLQEKTDQFVKLVALRCTRDHVKKFVKLAEGLVMNQKDWDIFWKEMHKLKLSMEQ